MSNQPVAQRPTDISCFPVGTNIDQMVKRVQEILEEKG